MQSYFLFEFQRAKCGLGNYDSKLNLCSAVKDLQMPSFLPLEDIIRRVKSITENEPCKVERPKLLSSQTSLAKTVTEMGLVSLNTSLRVCVVKSPSDETVHVVRNTTNGALCSCASTGKCYHILAVEMATGLNLATKQTYSLSVMRKRGRGNEEIWKEKSTNQRL